MADKCSHVERYAALKAIMDAREGKDSSDAFKQYDASVQKKYLQGFLEHERSIHDGQKKLGLLKDLKQELFFTDVVPNIKDPATLFGKKFVSPLEKAGDDWNKAVYKAKAASNKEVQRDLWDDIVKPVAEDALEDLETTAMSPDLYKEARIYLEDMRDGVELFRTRDKNPIFRRADNVVSKLVAWNFDIFGLNFLEYNRVFAKNPARGFVGLAKAAGKTKGMFWREVKDLKQKGVYGRPTEEYRSGLISLSDNWLRTASYYAGESFGGGHDGGMKYLKEGAFGYRIGNTPKFARRAEYRSQLQLMRYGIELYKYLGSAMVDLSGVNGAKKAAQGASTLILWAGLQSAMTGARSVVPAGLWDILQEAAPDLTKDIRDLDEDESSPFNLVSKTTGFNVTAKSQPGGLAFGVGYDILNRDYERVFRNTKKSIAAAKDGDTKEAFILGGRAGLILGATTRFPVGDVNQRKIYDALEEYWRDEIDADEILPRITEKVISLKEPLTYQGEKEYKRKAKYR